MSATKARLEALRDRLAGMRYQTAGMMLYSFIEEVIEHDGAGQSLEVIERVLADFALHMDRELS